jgi:hypothetical protein
LRLISVVRSLYFRIFSVFLITFLSPEIATYIYIHVPFLLSWIMMPNWLLGMVLSVCTSWFNISLPCLHLSCFQKSTFQAGIKIFNSLQSSVTILKIDNAKFKAASRKYPHTHSFYPEDEFFYV